jgi:hypothetical protein
MAKGKGGGVVVRYRRQSAAPVAQAAPSVPSPSPPVAEVPVVRDVAFWQGEMQVAEEVAFEAWSRGIRAWPGGQSVAAWLREVKVALEACLERARAEMQADGADFGVESIVGGAGGAE